jgi:hypothetical protein
MSSDIVFNGKASELTAVLGHCTVVFLAKSKNYSTDQVKSAYFGSLFRGKALEWLGTKLENDPKALDDYDAFVESVRSHFGLSNNTTELVAEQAIRRLKQTGSAQKYANEFDVLAEQLNIGPATKPNFFRPGLKPEVARALVGKNLPNWATLRKAAIEIDEQLYAVRQANKRANRMGRGSKKKDNSDKN